MSLITKIARYARSPFSDPDSKKSSVGESLKVLDGLRGLAVLVVIASHTSSFGMYGQGSLGVLMFFFLSGFVLTVPYAENPNRLFQGRELLRFFANRALRILPIYIVAVIFIAWLLGEKGSWILANITFIKGWNHLWSVAEEARFYVLFPLVVGLMALIRSRVANLLLLAVLIYGAFEVKDFHKVDMLDGRFVSFYFWMFLGGVFTCLLYKWPVLRTISAYKPVQQVLSLAALTVLLALFFTSDHMISAFWRPLFPDLPGSFKMNGWSMPEMWFFGFLILFYTSTVYPDSLAGSFLQSYFLRHLGLLSYSLYLFHMPIFLNLRKWGFHHEGMFFATFAVTYAIALFSYVLIEKPFMGLKPWKPSPHVRVSAV